MSCFNFALHTAKYAIPLLLNNSRLKKCGYHFETHLYNTRIFVLKNM